MIFYNWYIYWHWNVFTIYCSVLLGPQETHSPVGTLSASEMYPESPTGCGEMCALPPCCLSTQTWLAYLCFGVVRLPHVKNSCKKRPNETCPRPHLLRTELYGAHSFPSGAHGRNCARVSTLEAVFLIMFFTFWIQTSAPICLCT